LRGVNLAGANLRRANLKERDLEEANLANANLRGANLAGAKLINANLCGANLINARLHGANLAGAELREVNLKRAKLPSAVLVKTNLFRAILNRTDLDRAILVNADLSQALLIETSFEEANLSGCRIYGTSVWNPRLHGAIQSDLIITPEHEPTITVDNLEVAQFIYLLLSNERIRHVIDTITTKVVLILGRFTEERIAVLRALRERLRTHNYVPVLFDFDKPASRDLTETIRTLAYLARFIIADLTEPRSIPHELQAIVPDLAVPVKPILLRGSSGEYGLFQDLRRKYHWVLDTYCYDDVEGLLASLQERVLAPAEAKSNELKSR